MATVYISIGMMKTGTTALQSFLRENEKALGMQGYCYPYMDLGIHKKYNDRNAHFLVYRSTESDPGKKKEEEKAVRQHAYAILEEQAKQHPNIILSDELIWHRSIKNENFWKRLGPNFEKIGCKVKVVVYVRRQDLLIQSLYNQSVKSLPRTELSFEECMNSSFWDYYPLDYAAQLDRIAEGIGKENLILRVYEKGQFAGEEHSIFSDFAEAVGLDLTGDFTRDTVQNNIGLNGNYLEIKRILNGLPEYAASEVDIMRSAVYLANQSQVAGYQNAKTSMFSYEDQIAYVKKFADSNARVAREYLGREDGILFYEPVKELPRWQTDQNTMYQNLILVMGEMFLEQDEKIRKLQEECAVLKAQNKTVLNSAIFRGYNKIKKLVKGEEK